MNKPDVGANAVRKWLDAEGVDAIADVNNSGVALSVNSIIKEKNGVFLASGSATSDLTGKACTPNTVQWTYDTYEFANGTARELTRAGGKTWFFISADYAFGAALERDATAVDRGAWGSSCGER
jgi:branched-chain amino acid transport system substrate-binding protein